MVSIVVSLQYSDNLKMSLLWAKGPYQFRILPGAAHALATRRRISIDCQKRSFFFLGCHHTRGQDQDFFLSSNGFTYMEGPLQDNDGQKAAHMPSKQEKKQPATSAKEDFQ